MNRYLLIALVTLFFSAGFGGEVVRAETTAQIGTYTSAVLSGTNVARFNRFYLTGVTIPAGTSLTVEFSGNQSNFSTWSAPVAMNDSLDISTLAEVQNSTQIKVRVTMTSTNSSSPSIQTMAVSYQQTPGATPTMTTLTPTIAPATNGSYKIRVTSPKNNVVSKTKNITLKGTYAPKNALVTVEIDGKKAGSAARNTKKQQWSYRTRALSNGTHTIVVTVGAGSKKAQTKLLVRVAVPKKK